jgi:hypothetical protein
MFVFLSYKSEDSNLVRQVAEQLIGCGLEVWFNEYRILVGEYDEFQTGIDEGLRLATHAVVFTNNRWSRAEWCRYEMRGLLASIADRSRIVEVAIPSESAPREVFPDLLGRPAVIFHGDARRPRADHLHDLVVAILERLELRTDMPALPTLEPQSAWLPSYGVTFDPGPFTLWVERSRLQRSARFLQSDPALGLRTIVYHLAGAKLEVSMDVYVLNYESPISGYSISDTEASDDRAVYTAYRRYAKRWFEDEHGHFIKIRYRPKGLHLVFVEGTSQVAVTYSVVEPDDKPHSKTTWERRYAVRIPNPLADAEGELAFVFSVDLPGDEAEQTRAFFRLAPLFDSVVTSARLRWPSRLQSAAIVTPALIAKGAVAGLIAWSFWRLFGQHASPWRLSALAVMVGITTGDLARYLCNSKYRAALGSLRPALYDVRPISSLRRFVLDGWFQLLVMPYVLFDLLWRGLVVAVSFSVRVLALLLFVGWALMYSQKAVIAPPPWLDAHRLELLYTATGVVGIMASHFAAMLVKARYLKVRPRRQDDAES